MLEMKAIARVLSSTVRIQNGTCYYLKIYIRSSWPSLNDDSNDRQKTPFQSNLQCISCTLWKIRKFCLISFVSEQKSREVNFITSTMWKLYEKRDHATIFSVKSHTKHLNAFAKTAFANSCF